MGAGIRIGFDHPFQPFAFLREGSPAGTLIERVGEVLGRAGIPFTWVPMTLEQTEPALFSGAVDALAFKGITAERRATMEFSRPLVISGAALFRRAGLPVSDDPRDFKGMRAVTPRKGPLAAQLARDYPGLRTILVDSYEAAFESLIAGEADVAALNFHAGIQLAEELYPARIGLPIKPYAPLPIAFAVAKGRPDDLLERFDRALAGLTQRS